MLHQGTVASGADRRFDGAGPSLWSDDPDALIHFERYMARDGRRIAMISTPDGSFGRWLSEVGETGRRGWRVSRAALVRARAFGSVFPFEIFI